jgi:hypothetical protein
MTRSENPYATHIPVLMALARLIPIRRVLEFGSGNYSTRTFLNSKAFPDVSTVHSIENDREWAQQISDLLISDPRLQLIVIDSPMSLYVPTIFGWKYELIFIDDSLSAEERAATIKQVAQHSSPNSIIAIHDFEVLEYRRASRHWPHRFKFTGFTPHVGIAWDQAQLDREQLRFLDRLIAANARTLVPDDIDGWVTLLDKNRDPTQHD